MFSWKKWFIKLGKKLIIVFIVEGGFITATYIETTQAELPPEYVHIALFVSLILSQVANAIKHKYLASP